MILRGVPVRWEARRGWFRSSSPEAFGSECCQLQFRPMTVGTKGANKAPEPTLGSVTPRAIESVFEVKQKYVAHNVARGAPAPSVAHL
jgi:hypothetical protein